MKMQPWSRKSILSCVPTQYVPGTLPMLWGSTKFSISSGFQWIYCWHLIVLLLLSFPFRDHGARKREREERENADHWGGRGRRCNCTFLAFIWNNLDHVTGKQVCDWSDPSREPMRREEGPFSTRYEIRGADWTVKMGNRAFLICFGKQSDGFRLLRRKKGNGKKRRDCSMLD